MLALERTGVKILVPSKKPRIGVGMLHQESNSFNMRPTTQSDLDISQGADSFNRWRGTGMPLGGALEVFVPEVEIQGLVAASGASGGPLTDDAMGRLVDRFALSVNARELDAVYLDLHWAMVAAFLFFGHHSDTLPS
jgi:microcystin degradation protein MlrC